MPDYESRVEVIDLEPDSTRAQLQRRMPYKRTLCLDWYDTDFLPDITMNLIDHNEGMREAYANAGRSEGYFEGPQFAIIRPEFRALRPCSPETIPEIRNVVVTFGGADPARRTLDAISDLRKYASENMRITIIIGPLVPVDYEMEIRRFAIKSSIVLRAPKDFEVIISTADMVLCSGGSTLLESMFLGKVAVVYPQTFAEENHARLHSAAGACVMRESMPEVIQSAFFRNSIASRALQRVDGWGAERIADAVLGLLKWTWTSHS